MATFRSASELSSYLVRAKLYPIERFVGSHKWKGKRCEICFKCSGNHMFSSSVTNETYKINHQIEYNEKYLVYLLIYKQCLKQYVGQTIDTFGHCRKTTKVTTENFNALSHVCQNTYFGISQARCHKKLKLPRLPSPNYLVN